MFGISWSEFLVILLVGVLVIPVRMWPDVARFLAQAVTFIRKLIWKITDTSEQIKKQIDLEKPIDDLIRTTSSDLLNSVSQPIKSTAPKKKVRRARKSVVKDGDKK